MGRDRSQRMGFRLLAIIGAGVLFLTASFGLAMPAFADDVTVSCYNNGLYIDDVDDVSDIRQAAGLCDSMYSACQGNCIACFDDFDLDENICVDSQGRQFLQ